MPVSKGYFFLSYCCILPLYLYLVFFVFSLLYPDISFYSALVHLRKQNIL